MAAKFSMVNTSGLFDQGAHLEASDRMQGAMEELKIKNERAESAKAQQRKQQEKQEQTMVQRALRSQEAAIANALQKDATYVKTKRVEDDEDGASGDEGDNISDDDSDDDALLSELDHDPELERLRQARMNQLKQAYEQKQELLAKGHGEYREITQDEFLKEVTSSPLVVVHFYHNDFERCKIMDMHLGRLAKTHIECKFLKLNAEKAPFFVEKLMVRVLPTVVCFKDGIAFPSRVIGFDGLTADDEEEQSTFGSRGHLTSSDTFPTIALARKLVDIGVINHHDADEDDD
uniref:Thioredoxin domain-containing protein n=1 Tax=Globisporangium ultimum (strain ATCC 200006 / CBS 805.95 / DAOM BR144) TaxID=431595 RepID=K3X9E1_GLOUD